MNQKLHPKTLVVGSSHHSHVTCAAWADLKSLNLKDFDIVLLNAASLDDETVKRLPRNGFFDEVRTQLSMLLGSGGRIIAVTPKTRTIKQGENYRSIWEWSPIAFGTHDEAGDTIEIKTPKFQRYLSNLKRWEFYFFIPDNALTYELTRVFGPHYENQYLLPCEHFVVNRYGKMLAGEVPLLVTSGGHNNIYGSITLLPFIEELEQKQVINLILEDLLGEPQQSMPPAWIDQIPMPFVDAIKADIAKQYSAIESLRKEIASAEQGRDKIEKWKKLVYATGRELEEIVEEAFIQLGATIRAPVAEEEFIFEFNGVFGVIECKGVGKSISLEHLRQTDSHVLSFIEAENREAKGVLLGNAWRNLPLDKRGLADTPIFPDNVVVRARQREIALVSAKDFLNVFCRFLTKQVSGGAILDAINTQSGVVEFSIP